MKKTAQNRTLKISVALSPQEYSTIEKRWQATTCRTLTEYNRNMLFGKPVIMSHRNRSLDAAVEEIIELKGQLNAIASNFEQFTKHSHFNHQSANAQGWFLSYTVEKEILFNKLDEIKNSFKKISESWLQ